MAASVDHFMSKEVENRVFRHSRCVFPDDYFHYYQSFIRNQEGKIKLQKKYIEEK